MKIKFGILYICTGNYTVFWKKFYECTQKYLLDRENYELHYFVFTDARQIDYESDQNVHKIYQEKLPWPLITLNRFTIFQKALPRLETMDYIFFFNANLLLVERIGEEILPTPEKPFSFLLHYGMLNRKREKFIYERNPHSRAFIPEDQGTHYYAGGLNGGFTKNYMAMIRELKARTDEDLSNGIIAIWHDESHLNRFAFENQALINDLPVEYGAPEWTTKTEHPKIIILDKRKFGHAYLRSNISNKYLFTVVWVFKKAQQVLSNSAKSLKSRLAGN